jgi:type I restriction-modification system DNA methylase subunit
VGIMNALQIIENEFAQIGYSRSGMIRDYTFSDVLTPLGQKRSVDLAAFTQTPASYRTAAFGVIREDESDISQTLMGYRSLGAPVMLSISGNRVTVWQIYSMEKPRRIDEYSLDQIPALFAKQSGKWTPDVIHRAKSIGAFDPSYQLDFVDMELLPVIEGEIHVKLDRLLQEVISGIQCSLKKQKKQTIDYHLLFKGTFRLLAAKILLDCKHQKAQVWDSSEIGSILTGIEDYYQLGTLHLLADVAMMTAFANAWQQLTEAISFRNISADDLSFVYENTLVTTETRKIFGTHSTPRQVADYIVKTIGLNRINLDSLRVYEPFSGAGVFLVSAIRHIRGLLPSDWSDQHRHKFLTERIQGSEIDSFACEVAMLSLILADYPNANGWHIQEEDLFIGRTLSNKIAQSNIILCNPPFEDFTPEERTTYQAFASRSIHKPIAILSTVLDSLPEAIGFVLPRGFILDRQYAGIRQEVEKNYEAIEIVSLPDRIFKASGIESSLLIARDRRQLKEAGRTKLISTVVKDADRIRFLSFGKISSRSCDEKAVIAKNLGHLWLLELNDLWDYLSTYPTLGSTAEIHRGLEWNYPQSQVGSHERKSGYREGLLTSKGTISQYQISKTIYLDCNKSSKRGNALQHPWHEPKVIANAAPLTRGAWCFAAYSDRNGLVCSQQYFGIWPHKNSNLGINTLAALLNSPLTNAYLAVHSRIRRFNVGILKNLPIPAEIDENLISALVEKYLETLSKLPLQETEIDLNLNKLLLEIDATILGAYDLPPRLERKLLDYFHRYTRPVLHQFAGWFPEGYSPFIPLHEYIGAEYKKITGRWVQDVFQPLTSSEAKLLQDYIDE